MGVKEPRVKETSVKEPSFAELGVAIEIVEALHQRGVHHAFAIQELTLPLALDGKDIIGQARTGTGKTLGFGVPLLDRVFDSADVSAPDGSPRALVIVPTRELCVQVADDLIGAAHNIPVNVVAIYGGVPFEAQTRRLAKGADVVVGTPGRLMDLSRQDLLDLSTVEIVVLDEADEMLDQGFLEDVQTLVELTNPQRQTMLFSATLPGPIVALTRDFMKHPVMIQADSGSAQATHETTTQVVFQSHKLDRMSTLSRILQSPNRGRTIVFARTKKQAGQIAEDLAKWGFHVGAIHGDMKQEAREKSLQAFRTGDIDVIVATDVAARGIDVHDVTHVINYQSPEEDRSYVHRIGRTGRAGQSGTAVTLVGWDEVQRWNAIAEALDLKQFVDPPQWFSSTPEFLDAFGLSAEVDDRVGPPRKAIGVLPRQELHQRQARKKRR